VCPAAFTDYELADSVLELTLPPKSVVILELHR
jgi:hypothetical protein